MEGLYGEKALKLKVAAPPVDGKANVEIQRFLAKLLGVSRSQVSITKGLVSRDKVVHVQGVGFETVQKKLAAPTG